MVAPWKEGNMPDVHVLAIDLAKRSFQICATDRGGTCVDAPRFARRFFDHFFAVGTCIGRVSGLFRGVIYALAGMQFEEQGPHRFRELDARAPGLVYPILNIEVLAASLISRSPCRGFEAPGVLRFALAGRQRITPSGNSAPWSSVPR